MSMMIRLYNVGKFNFLGKLLWSEGEWLLMADGWGVIKLVGRKMVSLKSDRWSKC